MKKFLFEKQELASQEIIRIKSNDSKNWLSLFPNYGGTTHELVIDGQSILETAQDEGTFETITQATFAGMQLFPFPNRIRDGKYTFGKEILQLEINDPAGNNALHGFVFEQAFKLVALDEYEGQVQLQYDYGGEIDGYPFRFKLGNTFKLMENGFSVQTTVTNIGEQKIPIGHGWHPYFSIGEPIENTQLQILAKEHYVIAEDYIATGEIEPYETYKHFTEIGKAEFNHCFKIEEGASELAKLYFPSKKVTVKVSGKNYPYLQVYIPSKRKSIALEPQSCIPDAFNNGIGLMVLEPNKSTQFEMTIEIE